MSDLEDPFQPCIHLQIAKREARHQAIKLNLSRSLFHLKPFARSTSSLVYVAFNSFFYQQTKSNAIFLFVVFVYSFASFYKRLKALSHLWRAFSLREQARTSRGRVEQERWETTKRQIVLNGLDRLEMSLSRWERVEKSQRGNGPLAIRVKHHQVPKSAALSLIGKHSEASTKELPPLGCPLASWLKGLLLRSSVFL